jgi:hypothetical protein
MCTHGVNMLILFYGWPCGKKYHDKIWDRAKKKEEMIPCINVNIILSITINGLHFRGVQF